MTNHLLSAAQHARRAAQHAAAAGDRASYWALLATTERMAGDPELGLTFGTLAARCEERQPDLLTSVAGMTNSTYQGDKHYDH